MGAGSWAEMARLIPGRSGDQCRKRWAHHFVKKPALAAERASALAVARELGVSETAGKKRKRTVETAVDVDAPLLDAAAAEAITSSPPGMFVATAVVTVQDDELSGSLAEFSVLHSSHPDTTAVNVMITRELEGEENKTTSVQGEHAAIHGLSSDSLVESTSDNNIAAFAGDEAEEPANQLFVDFHLNKKLAVPRKKIKSR